MLIYQALVPLSSALMSCRLQGGVGLLLCTQVSQQLHWAILKYPVKPVAPTQLSCVPKVCSGRLAGAEMALLVVSHCGD